MLTVDPTVRISANEVNFYYNVDYKPSLVEGTFIIIAKKDKKS